MVEIDCLSFVEAVWHSSEEVVETLENLPPNKALLLHRKKQMYHSELGNRNICSNESLNRRWMPGNKRA
ncbi:hypothetical protein [Aeribacillus sp. FSL M8-0235]|uniref:hypothetical protein n=1 Tax=Aeribacillus sp. FSL M8-0235 TaxID=2954576 RepID=UPI0028724FE3|nr:hypothetical protein [Aeribacillus pallidus]